MDELERAKLSLLERQAAVQEAELQHKKEEARKSTWRSPLVVAILAAAIAGFSNAGITYYNAKQESELAEITAENARILEMIKIGDPAQVQQNLLFLIEAKLVQDSDTVASIRAYYQGKEPGTGPGSTLPAEFDAEYLSRFNEYMRSRGIRHFIGSEFLVLGASNSLKGGRAFALNKPPPVELWENIATVALVLDEFRERHGAPVRVISAFRTEEYASAVGSAPKSLHIAGLAIDFMSTQGTPEEWAKILRDMRSEGIFSGGIGVHSTFVHVDAGGRNADWKY